MRRRRARRVEARIPFTFGTDLALGISLRVPRRRRRARRGMRSWSTVIARSALLVINLFAPAAIVLDRDDLTRAGQLIFPPAQVAPLELAPLSAVARPVMQARRTVVTVDSPDPPRVRAHVVAPGETLLSIAAQFGIAPQTIAYDNGISDSAQLHAGESLIIPPFDAAIHVMVPGDTIASVASRFGVDAETVRAVNRIAPDDGDATDGRALLLPVPDARYPGFRLRLSDPPRVLAPRVRWPVDGVITQLFSQAHTGVDIAAPFGTPIVGWRGDGGLAVCVRHDWGLETCAYHTSQTYVEVGDRVDAGQRIAAIGLTGVTTGPHVHWEARTNGALVDPLTYAAFAGTPPAVGGATGSP